MIVKRRAFPPGVTVRHPLDMRHYLPYRIYLLATRIAEPPDMTLKSGVTIRPRDWRVLACLGGFGPLTNTEISRVVGMDAATVTRSVQFLQDSGLVMTRTSRSDKRKQVISLTEAGGVAHDEIAPVRRAAAAKVERLLGPKDRKELYRILDRLDEALSAPNDAGDPEDVWDEPDARG